MNPDSHSSRAVLHLYPHMLIFAETNVLLGESRHFNLLQRTAAATGNQNSNGNDKNPPHWNVIQPSGHVQK